MQSNVHHLASELVIPSSNDVGLAQDAFHLFDLIQNKQTENWTTTALDPKSGLGI